ncbi:MAG: 50S ribosomal protein L31 [Vampirovibrionales bacterium]|nr:50S ribosomal protein L31 [Vampirovibrionales bacterium]
MKQDIHPTYNKITATCVCGNTIETGSVLSAIAVEICSACHPFFTGQQKMIDTEGRVDKFNKRYGKKTA